MSYKKLLKTAEHSVAGLEVNDWLWDFRATVEAQHGQCMLYEKVTDTEKWSSFVTVGIRKFLEHLEAKKKSAPGDESILVLLWRDSSLYVFRAPAFFDVVCQIENMELSSLLTRAKQETPIMALPAPKET